jgi:hypothetical protein
MSKMVKRISVVVWIFCIGFPAHAEDKAMEKAIDAAKAGKMTLLMRQKLAASKMLWEGMNTENFALITESLKKLDRIAKEATWQSLRTDDYQRYSTMFQRTSEEMLEKAKRKNIKALSMPFLRLNLNCMECHELVRTKVYEERKR